MKISHSKFVIAIAAFAILFIMSGCKKNNNSTNQALVSYKVKSILDSYSGIYGNGVDTTNFAYDSLGRVIFVYSSVNTNGNNYYNIIGDSMSITNLNVTFAVCSLSSSGLVTNTHIPLSGNIVIVDNLVYDSLNEIIAAIDSAGTGNSWDTVSNTWLNGNLITIKAKGSNISPNSSYTYTSMIEHRDNGFSTGFQFGTIAPGILSGRNSKNLISSEINTNINGTISNITYSYIFDNSGRVSTETVVNSSGYTDVYSYTYY